MTGFFAMLLPAFSRGVELRLKLLDERLADPARRLLGIDLVEQRMIFDLAIAGSAG